MRSAYGFAAAIMLAAVWFGPADGALAHDEKDPRHIAMTALGKHMKAIAAVAKGEAAASDNTLEAAQNIAATAQRMLDLFPEGSGGGHSRSKPEIWQDWVGFQDASRQFADAANGLVSAARGGDRKIIGTALAATGKTCKTCHQAYRKPKKN